MKKPFPPIYYSDYLQLDKLLKSQSPKSDEYGNPAHDELLFIIIHQAYELWFKQIIHELDSVIDMFKMEKIDEKNIGIAISRLRRIVVIQKVLIDQLNILETMTPLDFLDFRDYLIPASGFQSIQFRMIENKLGLNPDNRVKLGNKDYYSLVSSEHKKLLLDSQSSVSILAEVDQWLSRIPFIETPEFNFKKKYGEAIEDILKNEKEIIINNPSLSVEKRDKQLKEFENTKLNFEALLDENKHNELMSKGLRRLSYKATLAALFINLYRDEPILHLPFRFLSYLVDIDENFTTWRYKHALMVHRMIGAKVGTGGSSGHHYLMQTAEKHKVFGDLFDLPTYLIPRSELPELPADLKKELGFYYTGKIKKEK
ncbi:MAG: Tryptophan 2,3-dioxygenase [Ignavibacteria bacterium]|nr:Tryptophan 2,3-dioxygenase [Ignavibacteria bacterium]